MSLALLAAVVLAAAEPAAVQTPDTTATPPTAVAGVTVKPKPDPKAEKVCWDEKPTGSHFPTHVCVSRQEFDQRQRADQDAVASGRRVPPRGSLSPN